MQYELLKRAMLLDFIGKTRTQTESVLLQVQVTSAQTQPTA